MNFCRAWFLCAEAPLKKFFLPVLSIFALVTEAPAAWGDSDAPWALGGGVGLDITLAPSLRLTQAGPITTTAPGLLGAAFVERRLTRSLWLTLDAHATAGASTTLLPALVTGGKINLIPVGDSFQDFGASLGLRYVLNPGALVEVSPTLAIGPGYRRSNVTVDGAAYETSKLMVIGASAGVALEHALTGYLYIRLSSDLLAASYNTSMVKTSQPIRSFSFGLAFSPTLNLRLAF